MITGAETVDPRLHGLRDLAAAYALRTPVQSVAVVGNAPMEPSRSRAEQIDTCDLVVRVNSFVLDESPGPPCQGARVDMVLWSRLVPATPHLFSRYSERLYVLLEPMRMYGRREIWPSSWPRDLGFVVARNDAVATPLLEALGVPWREQHLAPTTGTTAAWLARALFPDAEVLLSGISLVHDPEQKHWDHQWGDSVVVGAEHRIAAEAKLLGSWIERGAIRPLPLTGDQ